MTAARTTRFAATGDGRPGAARTRRQRGWRFPPGQPAGSEGNLLGRIPSAQPTMPPQKEPRTCAAGRVRSAASGAPRHARYLAARRRPPWPAEGTGGELAWTSDGHLSYHPCGMPPPTNAAIGTTSQQQVSAGWSHVDRLAGSSGRGGAASGGAGCRVLPKSSHRPWPDQGLEGPTLGHLAKLGRATALSPCLPCRGSRPVRSARARSTCVAASVAAAQRAR